MALVTHLVGFLGDVQRAGHLGGAAAVHDALVAHHAQRVVHGALGLRHDHAVAAAHEDGDGLLSPTCGPEGGVRGLIRG